MNNLANNPERNKERARQTYNPDLYPNGKKTTYAYIYKSVNGVDFNVFGLGEN